MTSDKPQQWDIYKNGVYMVSIPYQTASMAKRIFMEHHGCNISDKIEAKPTTRMHIVSCWCQHVCTGHREE